MRISRVVQPSIVDDVNVIGQESSPATKLVFLNGQLMRENVDYRFDSEHIHFLRRLGKSSHDQVVTIVDCAAHITNISFVA